MGVKSWTDSGRTAYVDIADTLAVNVTGATFSVTPPAPKLKVTGSGLASSLKMKLWGVSLSGTGYSSTLYSKTSAFTTKGSYATVAWDGTETATTSSVFTASNKTTRVVTYQVKATTSANLIAEDKEQSEDYISPSSAVTLCTITATLNAPPTCSYTQVSSSTTGGYYKDVSTAKVTISNLSAKYGGTISECKLTIGSQTATRTSNGDLTIKLNATGTFTPTVSLKDSRGQTRTYTLNAITVSNLAATTFNYTQVSSSTSGFWSGISTATVTLSSLSVPQSGTATAKLTIGSQSVTRTSNGNLNIAVNQVGTFTPTLTVTDSFGRVYTKTLNAITIKAYTAPAVVFTAERTDENGDAADEGKSAVVTATFTYTNALTTLIAPTVVVTDPDNQTVSLTTTWYKDRALTSAVSDWSAIVPADMPLYAFLDNANHDALDTQDAYQIAITPKDTRATGTTITQTLAGAFYTVDFLAGGHGIAFGQPAVDDGFWCNMPSHFENDLYVGNVNYKKQNANLTLASPNGSSGQPTFRKLVAGDMANQSANLVLASPNGSSGQPTFRKLVAGDMAVTTPTMSVTATTGTLVAANVRQYGKVVHLNLSFTNSSSVAAGGNVFVGTINTTALRPLLGANGVSYYAEKPFIGVITSGGAITVKNASNAAVTATVTSYMSFTYIIA